MTIESERERQAMIQRDGGEGLARAILYRRRIMCRVYGNHAESGKCEACGQ